MSNHRTLNFVPKGKLDRNVKDLKKVPTSHNYIHVVPLQKENWDVISFFEFLLTLHSNITNSPYTRGRRDHYKSHGECMFCQKKLYNILIDKSKKQ